MNNGTRVRLTRGVANPDQPPAPAGTQGTVIRLRGSMVDVRTDPIGSPPSPVVVTVLLSGVEPIR
jgi:hypothetical protein